MTLPNLITIARLLLVPLVVAAIGAGYWRAAFLLFVIAGVSDAVDGFIARRWDMRSVLGAYIDPFADKALLVSIYVTLSVTGTLPGWVAILVVSRDLMILSAIVLSWLLERPMEIRPLGISKINTAAQIGLAAMVLAGEAFGVPARAAIEVGVATVAVLTLMSAGAYLALWLRHMAA